jgi:tRNA A37 threonylcarbamoyladenosine biosynthesis protein TsaE
MNIYEGTRQVIHMDAYRLESPEALDALMIEDFLQEPWVVLVEWPENVNYELFGPIYRLELFIDNGAHFVRFHSSLE